MAEMLDRLEGCRLVIAELYSADSDDNRKAWEAIAPMLTKAGEKGARYEFVVGAASRASGSVGKRFVAYLVRMGKLRVLPRARQQPSAPPSLSTSLLGRQNAT